MTSRNPKVALKSVKPELLKKFVELNRRHTAVYSIISRDPPIFYVARYFSEIKNFTKSFQVLFDYLQNRPAYFLYAHDSPFSPEEARQVAALEAEHRRRYPLFRFIHLCNYTGQIELFERVGLKTIFCNHNAFVDENIFKPLPSVEKKYDAVYDARLLPFKRHYLAADVRRLGLVYYSVPTKDQIDFSLQVKSDFSDAHFFNHNETGEYQVLDSQKVNKCLNECRVGLCLSEGDGAQYASIQYLLAGLPVVETKSFGGRDVFFENEYSIRVEPTVEAVKNAVDEMIKRKISPALIRRKTFEKMRFHRQNFISLIQSIYEAEKIERDFSAEWNGIFFNRMVKNLHHIETIQLLEANTSLRFHSL